MGRTENQVVRIRLDNFQHRRRKHLTPLPRRSPVYLKSKHVRHRISGFLDRVAAHSRRRVLRLRPSNSHLCRSLIFINPQSLVSISAPSDVISAHQVYAYPEHADSLETVYAETTRLSQFESGIIYYCIARDGGDPTLFHFFERYKGRKAFEEHNQQPIIQKLMADKYIKGVKAKFVKAIRPATE